MLSNDDIYLGHMLEMTRKALELSSGIEKEEFDKDEKLQFALVHLIQVIGEAARKVSPAGPDARGDYTGRGRGLTPAV
jgi:uncharacterized protein with HEPN domain